MLLSVLGTISSIAQFITVLLIFLFVCVITYYTTKFIASFQSGKNHAKNIDVIETYRITNNKFIQIVRTGEKYMAIAVCKDSVTLLCELKEEEIVKQDLDGQQTESFKEIFEKVKQMKKVKKQADKDE